MATEEQSKIAVVESEVEMIHYNNIDQALSQIKERLVAHAEKLPDGDGQHFMVFATQSFRD